MPLSSSWEPAGYYSPRDYRINQISIMVNDFHYYCKWQGDSVPSQTQVVGSTAWLWFLKSSFSQSIKWVDYFLNTADIDLRNLTIGEKENLVPFYREKTALYDLAFHQYNRYFICPPPNSQTDYAQITFLWGIPLDWTITTIVKAPLHNYDTACNLDKPTKIRFNLPSFIGAAQARTQHQFLLNPLIFQIKDGKALVNLEECEEKAPLERATNINKKLSWVIKTICKISMTGVTLAEHTINYLNALANTPLTKSTHIRPLNKVSNGSALQSVLVSFYHVFYKLASNDDKYIFENALKRINIKLSDTEKSLYQVFIETIRIEDFSNLTDVVFTHLITTDISATTPEMQNLFENHKPAKIPASAPVPKTPHTTSKIEISTAPLPAPITIPAPSAPAKPSYSSIAKSKIPPPPTVLTFTP